MFSWFGGSGNKNTEISDQLKALNTKIDNILKILNGNMQTVENNQEINQATETVIHTGGGIPLVVKTVAIDAIKVIEIYITKSLESIDGWKDTIVLGDPTDSGVKNNFQISEFMLKVNMINVVIDSLKKRIDQHVFNSKHDVERMITQINTKVDSITLLKIIKERDAVLETNNNNIRLEKYTRKQETYLDSSRTTLKKIKEIMTKLTLVFEQ